MRVSARREALPAAFGVRFHSEIGAAVGMTSDEVSRRMQELRAEIRAQVGRDGGGHLGATCGPSNQPKRAELRSVGGDVDSASVAEAVTGGIRAKPPPISHNPLVPGSNPGGPTQPRSRSAGRRAPASLTAVELTTATITDPDGNVLGLLQDR